MQQGDKGKKCQDTGSKLGENFSQENKLVVEASSKKVKGNISNKSNNGKIVTCYICGGSYYMQKCLNRGSLTALVVE